MNMSDVSDKDRTFIVWLDKNVPGMDTVDMKVVVKAGDDADLACEEALDSLIANELYSGWMEDENG